MIEFDPVFPFGVADYLARCRDRGMTFEEAWTRELDDAAKAAGFSWQPRPFVIESTLHFVRRHFRAAYEGVSPLRYCDHDDCVYLALFDGHCALHVHAERIAS